MNSFESFITSGAAVHAFAWTAVFVGLGVIALALGDYLKLLHENPGADMKQVKKDFTWNASTALYSIVVYCFAAIALDHGRTVSQMHIIMVVLASHAILLIIAVPHTWDRGRVRLAWALLVLVFADVSIAARVISMTHFQTHGVLQALASTAIIGVADIASALAMWIVAICAVLLAVWKVVDKFRMFIAKFELSPQSTR